MYLVVCIIASSAVISVDLNYISVLYQYFRIATAFYSLGI